VQVTCRHGQTAFNSLSFDLDADHVGVWVDFGQPGQQFYRRNWTGTKTQVDHDRMIGSAQNG
jgi:hypothetical protein